MSVANWREQREDMRKRIAELAGAGKCFLCEDLRTGRVLGPQPVLYEDEDVKVVLDRFPRTRGHSVVILREHRDDISELDEAEARAFFGAAVRTMRAIRKALGAERVYMVAINDQQIAHVHLQLVPRYPKDAIGPRRLVHERSALVRGEETAKAIRSAMEGS